MSSGMDLRRRIAVLGWSLLALLALGWLPANAQLVCQTDNCAMGTLPPGCDSVASPRIHLVLMTGSFPNFIFDPSEPRIEPDDCIEWDSTTGAPNHSASDTACPDGNACNSPPPPGCIWETGNVAPADPTVFCHYAEGRFPPNTTDPFYCRIHATPTSGSMRGEMQITSRISLTVNKDQGTGDVVTSWLGGGIAGDETFRVAQSTGDKTFAPGNTITLVPNDGARGHRFAGELVVPSTRFYLVRNRQPGE